MADSLIDYEGFAEYAMYTSPLLIMTRRYDAPSQHAG